MSFEPQNEEQAALVIAGGLRDAVPILSEIAALEQGRAPKMVLELGVTVARMLAVVGASEPLRVLADSLGATDAPALLMEVGVSLAVVGELEAATERLQWAATAPEPEWTAWNSLARVLAARGMWEDAVLAGELGLHAMPTDHVTAATVGLLRDLHESGAERYVDRFPWRATIACGAVELGLREREVFAAVLGLGLDDGLMRLARRACELDPRGRHEPLIARVEAAVTGR